MGGGGNTGFSGGNQEGGEERAWERELLHRLLEAQLPYLKIRKQGLTGISSMGSGVRLPGPEF